MASAGGLNLAGLSNSETGSHWSDSTALDAALARSATIAGDPGLNESAAGQVGEGAVFVGVAHWNCLGDIGAV